MVPPGTPEKKILVILKKKTVSGTNPTRPYYIRFFCEPPKAALFRYHKMRPSVLKPAGLVAIQT